MSSFTTPEMCGIMKLRIMAAICVSVVWGWAHCDRKICYGCWMPDRLRGTRRADFWLVSLGWSEIGGMTLKNTKMNSWRLGTCSLMSRDDFDSYGVRAWSQCVLADTSGQGIKPRNSISPGIGISSYIAMDGKFYQSGNETTYCGWPNPNRTRLLAINSITANQASFHFTISPRNYR